ncbi:hypothetical protein Glove_132g286 [Diversispora epigaea]|uniref:Protein kinase domain-containing protein n=1 Tax=Diversispora epigaea TaxID=1348612 RepID=A0A397J1D3_9GLOM|nr:hypothetical protein Glove_132g286 [Diversispora epigaea]
MPYIAPEVLSGDEEYIKAADVYSFGIIVYEIVTDFPPYPDIPHDNDLVLKICNGLRPKIPFHTPKLITRTIMRCWNARVTHRPTFEELAIELINSTTTTPLNYQTHSQAIYTSRLLNFSKLPKPGNEVNFERELEELTKSTPALSIGIQDQIMRATKRRSNETTRRRSNEATRRRSDEATKQQSTLATRVM